jgi:GNAT superfamily N-acetyltransferase
MGCVDTKLQRQRWARGILPNLMRHVLRGGYRLGRRARQFAASGALSLLRGELTHVDLGAYPAHLHINIEQRWRGQGLGRRLMEAYLAQLRRLRVRGVHLQTTSLNEAACRLYEKAGFRLLDARPTRLWAHFVDRPVQNRCYGLRLKSR